MARLPRLIQKVECSLSQHDDIGSYELGNLNQILKIPGVYIHLYGKATTSPNRKLGHYTILGSNTQELENKLNEVKKLLTVKST